MNKIIDKFLNKYNLDTVSDYLLDNMFRFILILLLFVFYFKIINILNNLVKRIIKRVIKTEGIASFFISIFKIINHCILILIILNLIGINFTGVLAILSALGLVLGFAFKETLSNVFGGIIILAFKPFKVGDVIEYSKYVGTVYKIEIIYTTLLNPQNEYIVIPNGNLTNNEIRNITIKKIRRLDITVGVGYSSNIEEVKQIINDIILDRKDDLFFIDQGIIIGMHDIGAQTLNFDIKVYVREGKYLDARYYLYESMKTRFDARNIDLPYNILDVYMK